MTITSTVRKAGPLLGNGAQTSWPFAFKVFEAADVKVTIADSTGAETVLTSNYSVTLNANQETSPGGTVTYPTAGAALPIGSVLTIIGDLDYDQPLDLPSGGSFNPLAIENQFDRTEMQIQQLREEIDRAARLPVTSAADADSLVADIVRIADSADNIDTVAGAIAAVNEVSTNIADVNTVAAIAGAVVATGANIAAVAAVGNDLLEPESEINTVASSIADVNTVGGAIADVSTVAGAMADVSAVAAVAADVAVVADNVADITNFADVYQGPHATDPTLRNDGGPLQAGDLYFNTAENALRAYSGAVWVAGAAGSVSVQNFSGDGVETEFTLTTAPTSENNAQIYIDGVYQQKNQFSIVGALLTFNVAPPAGTDNIEVVTVGSLALGETTAALVSASDGNGGSLWTTVQGFINKMLSSAGAAVIGFIQAGASAVARTLQDKLRDTVCVFDFMTAAQIADVKAGTIALDVTAAINAAIASVSAIGGVVYFPAGRYKTTSTILVPTGVSLVGDGYLFGHSASWEGTTSIYAVHTGVAGVSLKGAVGCTVKDLSIEGDVTAHPKVALLLGRSSAASSGFHQIERVGAFGYFSISLFYSIASECNTWTDLYGWLYGGGGKYGFFTSTHDVLAVDALVTSTNVDNTLIHPSLINSVNDTGAACIYMELSGNMGSWTFIGSYLIPYAGSYVIIANGAIDGLSALGPFTFIGVSGERLSGGAPSAGFNLTATTAVNLTGLTISGCRFDFLGGATYKQIVQSPNLTLVAPNIVMQPPEAFPYALTELYRSKIIGGVVSVGRYAAWTAPTFAGSWVNAYGAPNVATAYSMDGFGIVRLRGTVGGGSGAIFTLPADYRPTGNMYFPVYTAGGIGRVLITASTGVVSLVAGTTEVDLSTIQFRTA